MRLETIRANLGNTTAALPRHRKAKGRALTKWRRNGAHAQARRKPFLQKALGTKLSHRIDNWLPFENPASHREANCRVTEMHYSHNHPQNSDQVFDPSGEEQLHYRHNSNGAQRPQGTSVLLKWHGSNTAYGCTAMGYVGTGVLKSPQRKLAIDSRDPLPGRTMQLLATWPATSQTPLPAAHFTLTAQLGGGDNAGRLSRCSISPLRLIGAFLSALL
jgi:hypothetical protein